VKITDRVHLVASGQFGFSLTDDFDCHVYLLDGGDEYGLIDAGGGRDLPGLLAQIAADGLDPSRVRQILLTHGHGDHAAGAAGLRERLGARVVASPVVAGYVQAGDERAVCLDVAREAGLYPADFVFPACPVDEAVGDGATVTVGDLTLEVIDTPGHASGHVSYLLRRDGQTLAFCGDALFFGGRILLQNTWDCSLHESIRSVERLAALSLDGLYPGHLTFCVHHGRRQAERALKAIGNLLPPPQLT
jgi:glyoxylase-like metal-dependent hydrolase (beta-lactamase superfamily II)